MQIDSKTIKITALVELILTAVWVVLTGISASGVEPSWRKTDFLRWAAEPAIFQTLNYVNAVILTAGAVFLFGFLFLFLKNDHQTTATAGILFVPIYAAFNIFCYSIQISVVPSLARRALTDLASSAGPASLADSALAVFASGLIQVDGGSLVGYSIGNNLLSQGMIVSGGLFLISLLFMVIEFRRPAGK